MSPGRPLLEGTWRLSVALALSLVSGWPVGAGSAPGHPGLTTQPLWGGRFLPGRTTELKVLLRSETGGNARIRVASGSFLLTTEVTLTAGRTRTLALPVRPAPDGRVALSALLPDGTEADDSPQLHPERNQGALLVSTPSIRAASHLLVIEPADLPRTADGYGSIGALRLATGDLAALDPAQTDALAIYLATCRPLHLVGATDHELARIRATSGCGGRGVTTDRDLGGEWSVDRHDPQLAGIATGIERAWPPGQGQADDERRAAVLLLPYGLLLGALLLRRRPGNWVLAAPIAFSVLVWLALPLVFNPAQSLTWLEQDSRDQVSRFSTLIETRGHGHAPAPLRLPAGTGLPVALDGGPLSVHLNDTGTELAGTGPLFQHRRYLLSGATPGPLAIELTDTGAGYAARNRSDSTLAGVWFVDRGCAWPMGPLQVGETRSTSPPERPANADGATDTTAVCPDRAGTFPPPAGQSSALLVDLAPDLWRTPVVDAPGPAWLLIHPVARSQ